MTQTEALRLALEAFEYTGLKWPQVEEAITAIKAALEAKDEPVAWRTFDGEGGYDYRTYENNEDYANDWDKRNPKHKGWVEPLYTTPPQQKAKDERVQVSPLQFVEMVMEKEDCIGKPIIWAEWPNKEKNT
jgi:hypothetical protein